MRGITLFFVIVFAVACRNTRTYSEDHLFIDYKISGEEGTDSVSFLLHFREGGEYGPAIELSSPSAVFLDDQMLQVIRSSRSGPLYAITKHLDQLQGEHKIRFVQKNKKYFDIPFRFSAFQLLDTAHHIAQGKDLLLHFSGLSDKDPVRVLLTDTSYYGEGITRIDSIRDNTIRFSSRQLSSLAPGPVQLEIIREQEKRFRRNSPFRGLITLTYTIRREFILEQEER